MCRCDGELEDHLFHCFGEAHWLWNFVFKSLGLKDFLLGWRNWLGKHSSKIWNLTPLCLMWCILRESYRSTFEDMESSGEQLLESFIGTV